MEGSSRVLAVPSNPSPELKDLLQQLDADRAWLLQQIDRGRWPDLRLDLAALERELGQMIGRATELVEKRCLKARGRIGQSACRPSWQASAGGIVRRCGGSCAAITARGAAVPAAGSEDQQVLELACGRALHTWKIGRAHV